MSDSAVQHVIDDMELTLGDELAFAAAALFIVLPLAGGMLVIQKIQAVIRQWYDG